MLLQDTFMIIYISKVTVVPHPPCGHRYLVLRPKEIKGKITRILLAHLQVAVNLRMSHKPHHIQLQPLGQVLLYELHRGWKRMKALWEVSLHNARGI